MKTASCYFVHHKIENVRIGDNGAKLTIRGKAYRYFDEQTGYWKTFVDEPVTAWLDPEAPEFCTFTDSDMQRAFTVPLHTACVPNQFDEHYEREIGKAYAHVGVGKRLYSELKRQPWAKFRPSVVLTKETTELGREIAAQQTDLDTRRQREDNARKAFNRLGMTASGRPVRPGQLQAAESLAKLLEGESPAESSPINTSKAGGVAK